MTRLSARAFSIFSRGPARSELKRSAVARASALFVEEDRQSTNVIEKNLAKTKLEARVRQQSVSVSSGTLLEREKFQIILADPPYEKTRSGERFTEKLLTNKKLSELLAPGGVFVLEKRPGEALLKPNFGMSFARKNTAPPKSYFYPRPRQSGWTNPQGVHPPRRAIE